MGKVNKNSNDLFDKYWGDRLSKEGRLPDDLQELVLTTYKGPIWVWAKGLYVIAEKGIERIHSVKFEAYNVLEKPSIYIEASNIDLDDNKSIEDFVNKYGILGMAGWCFYVPHHTHEVLIREPAQLETYKYFESNNYIPQDLDEEKFFLEFYPERIQAKKKSPDDYDLHEAALFIPTREPLVLFKEAIKSLRETVSLYEKYCIKDMASVRKDSHDNDLLWEVREVLSLKLSGINLGLDRNLNISYFLPRPPSMLPALFLQLAFDISKGQRVAKCAKESCSNYFRPSRPNNLYCSPKCLSAEKQRAYRLREKEKNK